VIGKVENKIDTGSAAVISCPAHLNNNCVSYSSFW